MRSERALAKVRALELHERRGCCSVEIIDALERPDLAELDRVIATPTLVRVFPKPEIRIVGDLSGDKSVAETLELTSTQERCVHGDDDHA